MTFTMGQIQYQEWLVPYLEGTLDPERRALLEARLATDSVLAQEVEALRSTVGHLREAAARHRAARAATRPAQADLWPRLRTRLASPAPQPPLISPRVWWGTGLAAACGLALALVWEPLHHQAAPTKTRSRVQIASRDIGRSQKMVGPLNTPPPPPPVVAPAKPAQPKPAPQPPAAPPMSTSDPFAKPSTVAGAVHQPQTTYFSTAPKHMVERAPVTAVRPQFAPPPLSNRVATNGAGASDAHRQKSTFDSSGSAGVPAPAKPLSIMADRHRQAPDQDGNAVAQNDEVAVKNAADKPPKVATNPGNAPAFVPETAPPMPTSRPSEARSMAGPQTAANLETWLQTLAQAQQPPLFGTDDGAQQAAQVVTEARDAGAWNALRLRLEAQRRRQPQSLLVGRMLAAVYENGGQDTAALVERRRISRILGTSAEDWFQLARLAEMAGDRNTARQAYQRSLTPNAAPLSAEHADIAHQRLFP